MTVSKYCVGLLLLLCCSNVAAEFQHKSDVSIRLDDSSDRDLRSQYRVRFSPQLALSPSWSVHGFVSTGRFFPSAYNTFGEGDHDVYVRRLFLRHENGRYRTEIGVLPPYKGRVSSTGLSDEGWIKGARSVISIDRGELEFVLGELSDLQARNAIGSGFDVNYYEFEFSGRLNEVTSYEIGAEKMLGDSFLRTEVRRKFGTDVSWIGEIIHNVDSNDSKVVVSGLKASLFDGRLNDILVYYAYTGSDFGARAALTEDFLGFGHALGMELDGAFESSRRLTWSVEAEFVESRSRAKIGLQYRLGR